MKQTQQQDYADIGREISTAEFKGTVLAKLEYIELAICTNKKGIEELETENQKRRDWQNNMDTRIKVIATGATLFGGIIVWLTDKAIGFLSNK